MTETDDIQHKLTSIVSNLQHDKEPMTQEHRKGISNLARMPSAFVSPFPMDAESEIRRNIERHYEQLTHIEKLKTDVDHWRRRAELAESECERLQDKLKINEQHTDELKEVITALKTQFETGVQVWVNGINTLRSVADLKLVMPKLAAIEAPRDTQE